MRLPALLALLVAAPAAAQEVRPYAGKYAEDPRCADFVSGLPAQMNASARAMSARLGLPEADASAVVLELVDRPLGPQKDVVLGGTSTRAWNGRTVQWITLNPESHFASAADFDEELDHEMTHALLRGALGDAKHRLLPKWAREGLAVWAAGQGPARVAFWLTIHWDKPDPAAEMLNGLETEKHSLGDYPEDFLAIDAIEARKGAEGVREFVRTLATGTPCRDAAAAVWGTTWEEFEKAARAHSEAAIRKAFGAEELRCFRAGIELLRAGKDLEAAERAFFAVATRFPDSWAGALGLYYAARAVQRAGRHEEATAAFREFLAQAGPRTGLMDDGVWHLGLCLAEAGREGEAIAALDRLARDFSYSPQAPQGLLKAAELCDKAGRAEEARARYARIVADLPGTKEAGEAAKRLEAPGR